MFEELKQDQLTPDEVSQQAKADVEAELNDRELQYLSLEEVTNWQGGETVEVPDDTQLQHAPDSTLTGGDVDIDYQQAAAVGDEAVGGTVPTPDQDIVDDVAAAVGLELDDRTDVRMTAILEDRDDRRWELDPKSSEDYEERRN